ncbi:cytochrome c-type biogenesis protein CcmH [Chloroflexota bacterium]
MVLKKMGTTISLFSLSLLFLLLLLSVSPARVQASPLSDLGKQLICQCGCTLSVANCTHIECGSREEMTGLIVQKLDQGQSEPEITRFFVARYGEQVLASPPKRGFNLVAWLLPFAAILTGGGVIYLALKMWVSKGQENIAYAPSQTSKDDEKYRLRLEQELQEFEEKGFR